MAFLQNEQFFVSDYKSQKVGQDIVFFDIEFPNWIATDNRGEKILGLIKQGLTFNELVNRYSDEAKVDNHKSWLHVNSFIRSAIREKFVSRKSPIRNDYTGRIDYLKLNDLSEFWIHINNKCNLSCTHCLVSSGPEGDEGLTTVILKQCVDQAFDLGVSRFFITGGEPFVRKDIFELIDYITVSKDAELIILTNGTLLTDKIVGKLSRFPEFNLRLQISLDGATSAVNDPIRGKGSYSKIVAGIKRCVDADLLPTVTTAVNKSNIRDIPAITTLLSNIGVKNHHLLWLHPRGRAKNGNGKFSLTPEELLARVREVKKISDSMGLSIDNYESLKLRINSEKGLKYDGSNACWQSLCLYSNGNVYPSATLAGLEPLCMGNINDTSLKDIWLKNKVSEDVRKISVVNKKDCTDCIYKYICGGGDMESTYLSALSSEIGGDFTSNDPFCSLYKGMMFDSIHEELESKKNSINKKSGFNSPLIFAAKGHFGSCADTEKESDNANDISVTTLRSNCVLSVDLDHARKKVRDFYSQAAEKPEADLCCPTKYDAADTDHIPQEVLDRFYGCGSPVSMAGIKEGETMVDLGSGAGIDCFITAKKVGRTGHVIGIDMTDKMLEVANDCKRKVADNLGYGVVEFRKGFLENIPVENSSADIITSNCVINLSPDKKMVFSEMWRILKDFGRILISDIVAEKDVPNHMQANPRLWGECISGAITEEAFISFLEESGFYGVSLVKKVFWKEVEGYKFYSISVGGYKFEKKEGCVFEGAKALYTGPYKSVMDEEGHLFPRGEAVEVCTDTEAKLKMPPYKDSFMILKPNEKEIDYNVSSKSCDSDGDSCC